MSVRKISAKLGLAAVAVTGLVLTVLAPANADTVPGQAACPAPTPSGPPSSAWAPTPSSGWMTSSPPTSTRPSRPRPSAWANFDACLGNTRRCTGLGDNPDGSGFPCGADHTGTKAGVKRDEGVVDPAAAGGALPERLGRRPHAAPHSDRQALQRRGLRPLVGPDQHHRPRRRRDRPPVRRRQDRRGDAPGWSGSGVADRSADPQDLQRHVHQLEPGRWRRTPRSTPTCRRPARAP